MRQLPLRIITFGIALFFIFFIFFNYQYKASYPYVYRDYSYKLLSMIYTINDQYFATQGDNELIRVSFAPWIFQKLYHLQIVFIMLYWFVYFLLFDLNQDIRTVIRKFLVSYFNGSRHKGFIPLPVS